METMPILKDVYLNHNPCNPHCNGGTITPIVTHLDSKATDIQFDRCNCPRIYNFIKFKAYKKSINIDEMLQDPKYKKAIKQLGYNW